MMVKCKMKSSMEVNRDFWKNKCESERNKPFFRKYADIAQDMHKKFSDALGDEDFISSVGRLEDYFKKFLSVIYDKQHDTRFLHLELRDMGLKYRTLVLGVDADAVINSAKDIHFALLFFLEEWYFELYFSNILLEWC